MKKKYLLFLLCMLFLKLSSAEEMPACLKGFLERFDSDSTMNYGMNYIRNSGLIDKNIFSKDLKAGIPVEVYCLKDDELDQLPETTGVMAFTKQVNIWKIPFYAKGHCVCLLTMRIVDQSCEFYELENGAGPQGWDIIRKAWPENKGCDPILIVSGGVDGAAQMFHFPQKGSHNLTFLPFYGKGLGYNDSKIDSSHYTILDDEAKVLGYVKKLQKQVKKWTAEHPNWPVDMPNQNKDGGKNENK